MDDDDLRRGRPTNHKVYGEAVAVLAGDGLLTAAFEKALSEESLEKVTEKQSLLAARALARAAGELGMVGGQILDILGEGKSLTIDEISITHSLKTGAMIRAAVEMGCIIGDAGIEQAAAARSFAEKIGLAFQIKDDLLDVEGDSNLLGKPIGKDVENNHSTFVSILGIDGAKKEMWEHYCLAIEALQEAPRNTTFLKFLLNYIVNRDH
jgi:geranylgeranyl diphosphate synthase type II